MLCLWMHLPHGKEIMGAEGDMAAWTRMGALEKARSLIFARWSQFP